jgi:hypothetical protein
MRVHAAMETLHEWIAEHPPPDERFTQTIAAVTERVRGAGRCEPCIASARTDEDVRLLARELGLADAAAVLTVAEEVYGDRLDAAARFFVEELFA